MTRLDNARCLGVMRSLVKNGHAEEVRRYARLSRREVGDEIGVSESAVWRWEHGDRTPKGQSALRYARLLIRLMEQADGSSS